MNFASTLRRRSITALVSFWPSPTSARPAGISPRRLASLATSTGGPMPSTGPSMTSVDGWSRVPAAGSDRAPRVGGRIMASSFLYTSRMIEHVDAWIWKKSGVKGCCQWSGQLRTITARTKNDSDDASTGAIVTSAVAVFVATVGRGLTCRGRKKFRCCQLHPAHTNNRPRQHPCRLARLCPRIPLIHELVCAAEKVWRAVDVKQRSKGQPKRVLLPCTGVERFCAERRLQRRPCDMHAVEPRDVAGVRPPPPLTATHPLYHCMRYDHCATRSLTRR